jgi:MarR family transcriptional regulator, organic hydroperoxide resistance regulator
MKGSRFAGPADSPGFLLWRVTNAWQRAVRAALTPLGLTHVQFVLLASLTWSGEGGVTQRSLADLAGTDEMMTSQAVRALEGKGLLTRVRSTTDGRAWTLLPTASGRRLAERAVAVVEAADEEFFGVLDGDRARFAAGLRTLGRMP